MYCCRQKNISHFDSINAILPKRRLNDYESLERL